MDQTYKCIAFDAQNKKLLIFDALENNSKQEKKRNQHNSFRSPFVSIDVFFYYGKNFHN